MSLSMRALSAFSQPAAFANELWRHRALLKQFTLRNIELRHKGSHLGLVWSLLNPLLMLSLYVFIFGYIFGGSFHMVPNESKLDYALGIFLGLSIFQFVAEVIAISPTVIIANQNLVKKVVFPTAILPASVVGGAAFNMLISLSLVLLGVRFLGPGLGMEVLWMPLILLPMFPLALGLGWFLAAFGVFLRDINQITGFATMALMYASALFFSKTVIPPAAWVVLRLNPLLLTVDLARNAVLWHQPMQPMYLLYSTIASLVCCIAGYACFRKLSPAFADVL